MAFPKQSGIYAIVHEATGRRYVGSSKNIAQRISQHLWALRAGRHKNPHLQAAWAKYGEAEFGVVVLELCRNDALLDREQFHIDARSEFNGRRHADRNIGQRHSDETKAKMSAIKRSGDYAHVAALAAERWKNPAYASLMRSVQKERLADPARRAEAVAHLNTPSARSNRHAAMQATEYRENMRRKLAGRKRTPEAAAAISRGRTGVRLSDETKALRSARMAAKKLNSQGGI